MLSQEGGLTRNLEGCAGVLKNSVGLFLTP